MQLELPLAVIPVAEPAGSLRYIQLGREVVRYRFRRARRRSIALVIDDGGLQVAAPGYSPLAEVEAFIRAKGDWVLKKLAEWRAAPKPAVIRWSEGESIPLLGAPVRIELVPGRRGIELDAERLAIGLAPRGDPAALRRRALSWLKGWAQERLGERLALYAQRMGVAVPTLALSNARTQWGVCREDGHVRLNWRLIHLPLRLVDYVVAHELAHLREMNHSARFWSVVGSLYPDYRAARSELRNCSHSLPIL